MLLQFMENGRVSRFVKKRSKRKPKKPGSLL
jgi:hypothetical protein